MAYNMHYKYKGVKVPWNKKTLKMTEEVLEEHTRELVINFPKE